MNRPGRLVKCLRMLWIVAELAYRPKYRHRAVVNVLCYVIYCILPHPNHRQALHNSYDHCAGFILKYIWFSIISTDTGLVGSNID